MTIAYKLFAKWSYENRFVTNFKKQFSALEESLNQNSPSKLGLNIDFWKFIPDQKTTSCSFRKALILRDIRQS